MTSDMQPFPAASFPAVVVPDDDYLVVPMDLADAVVPPDAVVFWLLLARLSEGRPEVEVSTAQRERHTGSTGAEIGEYVRALSADGWLEIRKGRMPGMSVYRILRRPTVNQVKEWAQDLDEPRQPPSAHRPSERPATPKHHAAFWLGRVADPHPRSNRCRGRFPGTA